MPAISSDSDLPKSLNTAAKRVKKAKKLVAEHLGSPSKRVNNPPMQGMFSRTLFLTLADGREVVVQFRTEPLDINAFKIARKTLGSDVVPDAEALPDEQLESEGAWAYSLSRMPGKMWLSGVAGKGADGRVAINKSLGRIFARGCIDKSGSAEAVTNNIRPHLEAVLASDLEGIAPYKHQLQDYLENKLEPLAKLPLWVSHYDINEVNVLIDPENNCEVTGLIDWELSTPLPFGVGFGRIHTVAGEYTGGEFWMPDEFEIAERGFWNELFGGMPADIRGILDKNISLVQDAVILGTLLNTFGWENGEVFCGAVSLKALPKFFTYRIPFIRVDAPPYKE